MPELLEIKDLRVLGLLSPKWRVAARTAATGQMIGLLGFSGQREEFTRFRLGIIDQALRNAVIADHRKAIFGEAFAQFVSNISQRLGQRNGSDVSQSLSHGGNVGYN